MSDRFHSMGLENLQLGAAHMGPRPGAYAEKAHTDALLVPASLPDGDSSNGSTHSSCSMEMLGGSSGTEASLGDSIASSVETLDGSICVDSPRSKEAEAPAPAAGAPLAPPHAVNSTTAAAPAPASWAAASTGVASRGRTGRYAPGPTQAAAAATAATVLARKAAADALTASFLQAALAPDWAHAESKAGGSSNSSCYSGFAASAAQPARLSMSLSSGSNYGSGAYGGSSYGGFRLGGGLGSGGAGNHWGDTTQGQGDGDAGLPFYGGGRRGSAELQRHTEAFELLSSADFNLKRALEYLRSARDTAGEARDSGFLWFDMEEELLGCVCNRSHHSADVQEADRHVRGAAQQVQRALALAPDLPYLKHENADLVAHGFLEPMGLSASKTKDKDGSEDQQDDTVDKEARAQLKRRIASTMGHVEAMSHEVHNVLQWLSARYQLTMRSHPPRSDDELTRRQSAGPGEGWALGALLMNN